MGFSTFTTFVTTRASSSITSDLPWEAFSLVIMLGEDMS